MARCSRCGWMNPPDAEVCIMEGCLFPLKKKDEKTRLASRVLFDEHNHNIEVRSRQEEEKCERQAVIKYIGKTQVGKRLQLFPQPGEKEWYVILSRDDHLPDNRFLKYSNRVVPRKALRELLPNGNSLAWKEFHSGVSHGCCAVDGNIRVIILMKDRTTRINDQIIEEFIRTLE